MIGSGQYYYCTYCKYGWKDRGEHCPLCERKATSIIGVDYATGPSMQAITISQQEVTVESKFSLKISSCDDDFLINARVKHEHLDIDINTTVRQLRRLFSDEPAARNNGTPRKIKTVDERLKERFGDHIVESDDGV